MRLLWKRQTNTKTKIFFFLFPPWYFISEKSTFGQFAERRNVSGLCCPLQALQDGSNRHAAGRPCSLHRKISLYSLFEGLWMPRFDVTDGGRDPENVAGFQTFPTPKILNTIENKQQQKQQQSMSILQRCDVNSGAVQEFYDLTFAPLDG